MQQAHSWDLHTAKVPNEGDESSLGFEATLQFAAAERPCGELI